MLKLDELTSRQNGLLTRQKTEKANYYKITWAKYVLCECFN